MACIFRLNKSLNDNNLQKSFQKGLTACMLGSCEKSYALAKIRRTMSFLFCDMHRKTFRLFQISRLYEIFANLHCVERSSLCESDRPRARMSDRWDWQDLYGNDPRKHRPCRQ